MASSTATVRPEDIIRRIGDTNERALAYVLEPDPQLSRMGRKVREAIIADLPPVTAGALLGPDALARHFIASAASGRYRDLFALWDLFRARPDECRPVLAERQKALEKGRNALTTAVRLGLGGHAERVAEDVTRGSGLIWTWLREALLAELPRIGARPAVASALLAREPGLDVGLPETPDDRWLAEAAAARRAGPLAEPVEAVLRANADRLPATIETLALAAEHYPERVPALVARIDLGSESIGALMAWARDHGHADAVLAQVRAAVEAAAHGGRAEGVATWWSWRERGMDVELPAALRTADLDGLDVSRPEVAALVAVLVADGAPIDPQGLVGSLAAENRQRGEKAYEAFVCAGLDVTLPPALQSNPLVREGTRCPYCQSWTYVRAGHERRCPRRPADADLPTAAPEPAAEPAPEPAPATDDFAAAFDAAMAEELSSEAAQAASAPQAGTPLAVLPKEDPVEVAPIGAEVGVEAAATAEEIQPIGFDVPAEAAAAADGAGLGSSDAASEADEDEADDDVSEAGYEPSPETFDAGYEPSPETFDVAPQSEAGAPPVVPEPAPHPEPERFGGAVSVSTEAGAEDGGVAADEPALVVEPDAGEPGDVAAPEGDAEGR